MQKSIAKISIIAGVIFCICTIICLSSCQGSRFGDEQNKKIIDSWGREVAIPRTIDKIATVGAATRLVVYAGAQDKLVAITDMDRPTELRPYTLAYPELFSSLPSTNNGNALNETTVDEEKLLELKPDVIISTRSADECNNLQGNTKIPVVGINIQKDLKIDTFSSALKIVGEATTCTERSNTLAGYYKSILNEIDLKCTGTTETFYRGAINYKGSKDLTGTYSHYYLYPYLKSTNVADVEGIDGPYDTSLEQILTWNPDYIFMDFSNREKVKNQIAENPEVFSKLKAFKNSKVYFVPTFNNNSTNFEYAMCDIAFITKTLYPQTFASVDLDAKYGEIFEKFLGKNIWPELQARGVYFGPAKF